MPTLLRNFTVTGRIKLEAEAKMGELLPEVPAPEEVARRANEARWSGEIQSSGERQEMIRASNHRKNARKVASVPEPVREAYFAECEEKQKTPTR